MYKTRKSRRYFYIWELTPYHKKYKGEGTYTSNAGKGKRTKCYKKKSNHKVRTHPFAQSGGWYKKVFDYKWTIT